LTAFHGQLSMAVVSAQPVDMPPAFENRGNCSFFHDFDSLFFVLAGFFIIQIWLVANTFFCDVTNSEHTLNFDFTGTLRSSPL